MVDNGFKLNDRDKNAGIQVVKADKSRNIFVRFFQKAGSTAVCSGFSLKTFLIISICLFTLSISAFEKQNICEPSIVYNDLFMIDCMDIFSYTTANELYNNIDDLQDYLDGFDISEEQFYIRYLIYLRKKQLFPAIMSLIIMVNNNDYHFRYDREYKYGYRSGMNELLNLLEIYSKNIDLNSENNINNMFETPKDIDQLSNKLLYAINAMIQKTSSIHKILFSSLLYSISDIPSDIDFNNDKFTQYMLLYLMKLRNNKILSEYISYFDDSINGNLPKYSYRTFVILKRIGLLSIDFNSIYSVKNIITAEDFINRIEYKNQDKPDNRIDNVDFTESEDCKYLKERKQWISETMPGEHDLLLFNNSAMIVEQCHESFLLFAPFVQKGTDFIIFENNLWIRYFVEALDEIVQNRLDEERATELLEAGFRASLKEGAGTQSASWWFFFYLSTRDDYMTVLKALVLKQTAGLNWKSYNGNSESEATDIIFETLYGGKGL